MQNLSVIDKVLRPKISWKFNFNTGILYIDGVIRERQTNQSLLLVCSTLVDFEGTTSGNLWSNKWLTDYCKALGYIQWGNNLGIKFDGFQIPGGGTIQAQALVDKGETEKIRLEEYALEHLSWSPEMFQVYMS